MTAATAEPNVAVITGGGSGIGLATCTRLAEDGFTVAALDIAPAAAGTVAALALRCDVTDESDVAAAIATVLERFGRGGICAIGRGT